MKITPISNNTFFTGKIIVPNGGENKNVKYLYNQLSDFVKENHITTSFLRDKVELNVEKEAEKTVVEGLKALKIKFFSADK